MKIVGITACPTGIAHTYMAAEALTKAAQEMGHEIKIETQGVEVENILSDNDIQSADIVIIACQKTVDLSRFEGKRVTEIPIERAVKNPQKVIQDAIDGKNISIFELAKEDKAKKKAQQTGIYKHLMSGVNFMLPFVISGGILIAFSFMFGIKASDPNDPSFNVIAKALSDIGGGAAFWNDGSYVSCWDCIFYCRKTGYVLWYGCWCNCQKYWSWLFRWSYWCYFCRLFD